MKEEEIQLIAGIKAGDESAYNHLFNTYYIILTAFANKYVNDQEVARDIVQNLFVNMFESRKHIVIVSSLKAYLFQSVQNRCINYIKTIRLHEKHHDHMKSSTEIATDLEEMIIETELEQLIFQRIGELPDQCRRIFLLSRTRGRLNKEIAELLDISIRTVETQISKALKILREDLRDYLKP